MGSGAIICLPSSLKIDSGFKILMGVCVCVYGGEGQLLREFRLQLSPVERQVTSNSQTSPLVEEEAPFQGT
jgi:hypothetical protein